MAIQKRLKKLLAEGLIPKVVYNELVDVVNSQNIEAGDNITFIRNPNGTLIIAKDTHRLKYVTFIREGQLAETTIQNACGKIYLAEDFTIKNTASYIGTTSSSGSVDLDINVGSTPADAGTSLFSGSPKPSIAQGSLTDLNVVPDTLLIAKGKYLSIDIDDSGEGAKDLTVIIWGKGL